jgi:SOS response regulatory protein OraA/RecX
VSEIRSRGPAGGDSARSVPATPDPDDAAAAEEVAVRILGGASQSAAALQRRLRRRGFSAEVAEQTTAAMVARGYVDDAAFAQSIAARRRRTGHGRIAVIAELRAKGIDDTAVNDVATSTDVEDERSSALGLARRLAGHAGRDPTDRGGRQRLGAALQRRGFDAETVHWVLRRLAEGVDDPA